MEYSEKFSKLIDSMSAENREKLIYVSNFWGEKYIINNYEYIIDNFKKFSMEKSNTFIRPLENEYKELFEFIDPSSIGELLVKGRETIGTDNIISDSMLFFSDHLELSDSTKSKLVKSNYIYEKFINAGVLTSDDIINIIKDKFSSIKENRDYDMLDIEENIHSEIGNKIKQNVEQNYGSMEEFKRSKEGELSDTNIGFIEVATKTNKIYEIEGGLVYTIVQNRDKIDFTNLDNFVKEAGFLERYPNIGKSADYVRDCCIDNSTLDIDEAISILYNEIDEYFTVSIFDYMKRQLDTYKQYGSFDVIKLNEDVLDNLDKSKVEETLQYTHNIYNEKSMMLMSILGDRFKDFTDDEKSKLTSYLNYFEMSKDDIEFFKNNVDEIKNQDYTLSDVFYVKNIRCNSEVRSVLDNLPDKIKDEVLTVNVQANDYEIVNILDALNNYKDNNYKEKDDYAVIQRNLSSIPPEKKDELRHLILGTHFRKYQTSLGLNEDTTIGIELEVEGISDKIVKKLVDSDELLKTLLERQDIKTDLSNWEITHDESLKTGVEVVSPILQDNEKDWNSLQSVCSFLNSIGGKIDETCGGHIHIGTNILGTDSKAWENLFKIWYNCEGILYKISNPPEEEPREDVGRFASPTKSILEQIIKYGDVHIESKKDIVELSKMYTGMYIDDNNEHGKYKGLNLNSIATGKQDTIEFRIPNGQLDPIEIQRNVNLYARIVDVSKKTSVDPEYKKDIFDNIGNTEISEEERLVYLLDLTFDKISDKAIYYERYLSKGKELVISGKHYSEYTKKKPKIDEGASYR